VFLGNTASVHRGDGMTWVDQALHNLNIDNRVVKDSDDKLP
jgi:hypothetical protein